MCNLTTHLAFESATGWKVVAVKGGKKYSIAMGFCYDDLPDGKVPIVKEQNRIGGYFDPFILSHGNQREMEGRTAIFYWWEDAVRFMEGMGGFLNYGRYGFLNFNHTPQDLGYSVEVHKAIVSIGLMAGNYRKWAVIAGRRIKFGC
jgi:hypothetical protein